MVSAVAKYLPNYPGTIIKKEFIKSRLQSWQAHLQRISQYLKCGEGVWWSQDQDVYRFHDSELDLDNHHEGPKLKHFRHTTLSDVYKHNKEVWRDVVTSGVNLPTERIQIYRDDGTYVMDRRYPLAESSSNVMITEPSHSSSTEPLPSLSDTLTFTPSSSSDAMCIPLTDDPSRSDSSNAMQTPPVHGPSNPNDTLLTDCPSGSSAIVSTPKSENTTSNGHASTPISFTHSHGLKPTHLQRVLFHFRGHQHLKPKKILQ